MNTIPVGETIANAYSFVVRRGLAIMGLSWLPAAFYAVGTSYWLLKLSAAMLVSPRPKQGGLNDFALFDLICLAIITAFASAVIAVPLTREALERGRTTLTAYLAVGAREWRLFLGLLQVYALALGALLLIVFLGGVTVAVALSALGANAQWLGMPVDLLAKIAVALIAAILLGVLTVRFDFFISTLAAAEPKVGILRAWALGNGNFWRLLAIVLTLVLPLCLLLAIIAFAFGEPELGAALGSALSAQEDSTAFYQWLSDNAVVVAAIVAIALVISNALFAGASAFAYGIARQAVPQSESHSIEPVFANGLFAAEPNPTSASADYTPRRSQEPLTPLQTKRIEPVAGTFADVSAPLAVEPDEKVAEPPPIAEQPEHQQIVPENHEDGAVLAAPQSDPEAVSMDAVPLPESHAALDSESALAAMHSQLTQPPSSGGATESSPPNALSAET